MRSDRPEVDTSAAELTIARLASALGALETGGPLSAEEEHLAAKSLATFPPATEELAYAQKAIRAGATHLETAL